MQHGTPALRNITENIPGKELDKIGVLDKHHLVLSRVVFKLVCTYHNGVLLSA